jgi:hypothetical protein
MYGYRAAKTFILLLSKEIVNHGWSLKKRFIRNHVPCVALTNSYELGVDCFDNPL